MSSTPGFGEKVKKTYVVMGSNPELVLAVCGEDMGSTPSRTQTRLQVFHS